MTKTIIKMTAGEVQKLSEWLADEVSEATIGMELTIQNYPHVVIEIVCPECYGTGEVTTMERVYSDPGSPSAPTGTKKCECQTRGKDGSPHYKI